MLEAIKYSKIIETVNDEFIKLPMVRVTFDSVDPVSQNAMATINNKINKHTIVGILFCQPDIKFVKEEILSSLNYLHHRSEDNINFFCSGYGAYWPEDKKNVVIKIDGVEWSFSDKYFIDILKEFENTTNWKYSGETEFLLLDVIPSTNNKLNINHAIVCNLERMHKDGAFSSARSFFEELIRFYTDKNNKDALSYSDTQGIKKGIEFLKDSILNNLPLELGKLYRKTESYAIKDISK